MYELINKQREYLGLDLVQSHWDRTILKAGPYQPECILYFEGDVIKKQVISNEDRYHECEYNLQTRNKEYLLPKTSRGKEKKLTAATIEQAKPEGVYFDWTMNGNVSIANHNTQTTYYSTFSEEEQIENPAHLESWVNNYMETSKSGYIKEIKTFKNSKRVNIKYKVGDFFAFKISRNEYGFGRILMDINKLRKKKLIPKDHGLQFIMGPPLLVKIYAHTSENINVDIDMLTNSPSLPSDIIMDNQLFYGEYEIIGNRAIEINEYEFPISFGGSIDFNRNVIFLQWGLLHLEKQVGSFEKYLMKEDEGLAERNPFGYYSAGFYHRYSTADIKKAEQKGMHDFSSNHYKDGFDLRNPQNDSKRREIFNHFGIDSNRSYFENCQALGVDPLIKLN